MREWGNYTLAPLDDYETRVSICGQTQTVPEQINAIVLNGDIDSCTKLAKKRYQEGAWPILYFTSKGKGGIACKRYLEEMGGRIVTNLWEYDDVGHTDEAKKETGKILGDMTAFSTPKPVRLMDRILTIASESDSIILDFFAGSGTTGHAVLAHNAAHPDSHRKFILCTNNENGICRNVTYERLKRVMKSNDYKASLKYQVVDFVPIDERLYYEYADELLRHVRELVELENAVNFTGNAEIAIVLTDEELCEFTSDQAALSRCQALYLGHDILPNGDQMEALRANGIQIHIIPDYYYRELEG